jgi:hypothetical protein
MNESDSAKAETSKTLKKAIPRRFAGAGFEFHKRRNRKVSFFSPEFPEGENPERAQGLRQGLIPHAWVLPDLRNKASKRRLKDSLRFPCGTAKSSCQPHGSKAP